MCRSRKSRLKFEWVRAKVRRSFGPAVWHPAVSCLSSMACRSISRVKPCALQRRSSRSRRVSFSALSSRKGIPMKVKQRLSDLRVMSEDQLDQEVLNLKKEQFNLRFQRATGQLENTARVRVVRRDIARIKTLAAQKRDAAK